MQAKKYALSNLSENFTDLIMIGNEQGISSLPLTYRNWAQLFKRGTNHSWESWSALDWFPLKFIDATAKLSELILLAFDVAYFFLAQINYRVSFFCLLATSNYLIPNWFVSVVAPIGNSDHSSLSAVISMAQAFPNFYISRKVFLKYHVNSNTVCGAI